MRTTVVPAQITSVEDKIAGNLSFTQLLLLITPLFLSVALFILLPPFGGFAIYKVIVSSVLTIICLTLAIRIRGRLVLEWLTVRARYNARPIHYVYNKNDVVSRRPVKTVVKKVEQMAEDVEVIELKKLFFQHRDVLQFETATTNPHADFHFTRSKKGGLRVHIKEIK